MDPNDKDAFFQPSSPPGPVIMQPSGQPQVPVGGFQPKPPVQNNSKNKLVLIATIGGGLLLLVVVLVVAMMNQKPVEQPAQQSREQLSNTSIEPAEAIDIEQINNSINQEISALNDEKQLPQGQLDDKSIGL